MLGADEGRTWAAYKLDCAMEVLNLPFFYQLGMGLHPLTLLEARYGHEDEDRRLQLVGAALAARPVVAGVLGFHGAVIAQAEGQQLLQTLNNIIDWGLSDKKAEAQHFGIGPKAIEAAKRFETILLAELQAIASYSVSPKGAYSTVALIAQAEQVFPQSVVTKLTHEAIEEIRQAGRCLAFDTATAAGFHTMRATESVMHEYYIKVCQPQDSKKLENWGQYINQLRMIGDSNVKKVAELLQQVKDDDRNLVMHPEKTLDPDEALSLFQIGVTAITAMAPRL